MTAILDHLSTLERSINTFLQSIPSSPVNYNVSQFSYGDYDSRKSHRQSLVKALDASGAFAAGLDPLIARLTAVRDLQRQHTNMLHNSIHAPMLALPNEILVSIFERVVTDLTLSSHCNSLQYLNQVCQLTQICSRWRKVALSWPGLWSRVPLPELSPDGIATWIERSGQMPLEIVVDGEYDMRVVSGVIPRIRQLEVIPSREHLRDLNLNGHCFELLDTLIINRPCDFNPILWTMPLLRRLEIEYVLPNSLVQRGALAGVQVLSLKAPQLRATWNQLWSALEGSERLERLRLTDVILVDAGPVDLLLMTRCLQHLRHLHVSNLAGTIFKAIMMHALCPALGSLTIAQDFLFVDPAGTVPLFLDFLKRSPLLYSITLTIHNEYMSAHQFFSLLVTEASAYTGQLLPNLRDLYLCLYSGGVLSTIREALQEFLESLSGRPGRETLGGIGPDLRHSQDSSISYRDRLNVSSKGWSERWIGPIRVMVTEDESGPTEPSTSIPNFRPRLYDDDW